MGASRRRILAALAECGHDAKTLAGLCDRRARMPEAERVGALTAQIPPRIDWCSHQQRAQLLAALSTATRSIQPVVRKPTVVPSINGWSHST